MALEIDLTPLLQLARQLEIRLRVPVQAELSRGVLLDRIGGQYGVRVVLPDGQVRRMSFYGVPEIMDLDDNDADDQVVELALARLRVWGAKQESPVGAWPSEA